ncbi:myeloperoxidase-like isoform X2 [Mizuhopecten yessoensis]|uniref:myeloperoxidase-like isoform X2 n=1 Tax=Mizuhopecten yessoensis TaxID=6573 RepID=UPI000B45A5C1|nr:myeloperoxidase-like isoform X2 [Mizuhopecten yessoensis]
MLPSKAVVLLMCCLFLGNARSKLTSDVQRELEKILQELMDNEAAEEDPEISEDNDDIDITSRTSRKDTYEIAKAAIEEAKKQLEEEFLKRNEYYINGTDRLPGGETASSMAGLNDLQYGSEGEHEENRTLIALFATRILLDNNFNSSFERLLEDKNVTRAFSEEEGECDNNNEPISHLSCSDANKSEYRTINGSCNNIDNPLWGVTFTAQIRILQAEYDNELDSPRTTGVNGVPLPSARTVSTNVLRNASDIQTPNDPIRSVMAMAWGQFLDHDITETPMSHGRLDSNVGCCVLPEKKRNTRETQCFAIKIEPNDHHFTTDCMDLVRSLPTRENPCKPGVREQINAVTAFIDGSAVYGSEDKLAKRLRLKSGGAMRTVNANGSKVLPENDDSACVLNTPKKAHCLLAGDIRVNENPFLGSLHTAFVLYHNKLAERFATTNSSLTDEEIYQMTRKIIGAIIQHVTFSAWLPDVIGADAMKKYQLLSTQTDPYKRGTNPSIQNEFSTATLRHGHSMVITELLRLNDRFEVQNQSFPLENVFFKPDLLFEQVPQLVRWISTFPCKKTDPFMVEAVQDRLFNGLDLAALNIQRGREHGLPSYTKYRKLCNLSIPKDFDDLEDHIDLLKKKLETAYDHVDDIDLFVGETEHISINVYLHFKPCW